MAGVAASEKILSRLITAFLVICAALVTGALIKREFFPGPKLSASGLSNGVLWDTLATKGHWMGASGAPVKILEFSDFQCPSCAEAQHALRAVRQEYPHQVAVIYRHLPLEGNHPEARPAAVASECAAAQGRFEPFHDLLFSSQNEIGRTPWEEFARRANVASIDAFRTCLKSGRFEGRVDEDARAARALRLIGTPTIIVNGKMLVGSPSAEYLRREVQYALERVDQHTR
jgi:protein-disulfide isomerase